MYPANRDEILKGLDTLISTINKLLGSLHQEEGQESAKSAASANTSRSAAELLFANFPDDTNTAEATAVEEQPDAPAAAASAAAPAALAAEPEASSAQKAELSASTEVEAEVVPAAVVGEEQGASAPKEPIIEMGESEVSAEKVLEVRMTLCKHIIMQVDGSLGDLHDLLDTMEYYQDEKLEQARRMVAELEDGTNELIAYLRAHNRY